MTGAYAGFLNGGSSVKPYGLIELKLRDDPTPMMGQGGGLGERVISEESARQLVFMMNKVITSGTGTRARLPDREAAGKTGTTSAARDAWFIGFTADYVTGVWMGYDDNTPLTGVTGGGLPAEIWQEVMMRISEGVPPRPLPMIGPDPSELPPPAFPGTGETPDDYVAPRGNGGNAGNGRDDVVERVLIDVLNEIFGRGN
jgi:penicillin-binding protein 1A